MGTVWHRRQRLSGKEETSSSGILIITHFARCNEKRGSDYRVGRSLGYGNVYRSVTQGEWWTGASRESICYAGGRLEFPTNALSSIKNLSARQRGWMKGCSSTWINYSPNCFLVDSPAQVNPDRENQGTTSLVI